MNYKKLSFLFISLSLFAAAFGQKKQPFPDNLLFMLRQQEHITQALNTIRQLQTNSAASKTIKPDKTAIIVCGKAIKSFAGNSDNEMISEAKRLGVTLYGCGLSLKKFALAKADLMPGVEYVDNGFIKAFELQKQGYLSVEL
ncbi:MAG: DsrE family protein [Chitinophagaceae bacterium]